MNTAENTAGISTPPENPCTTRNTSSVAKSVLNAQPIDASVKRLTAVDEQPAQAERSREQAGQGNRDDLRDQIGGLDPAHRVAGDAERILDRRQRGGDDLDVQDRHEHAKAHQEEAGPDRSARRGVAGFLLYSHGTA